MAASSVCLLRYLSQWCIRRSAHGAFRSATNEWLSPSRAILCSRLCRAADGWAKQCLPGAGATEIALCFHPPSPLLACTAALSPASPCLPAHEHQASTHNACRSSNATRSECGGLQLRSVAYQMCAAAHRRPFPPRRLRGAPVWPSTRSDLHGAFPRVFAFRKVASAVFEAVPNALLTSAKLAGSAIGGIPHRAARLCWPHAALCIARAQAEAPTGGLLGIVCDMCTPRRAPSVRPVPAVCPGRRRKALEAQLYSAG